MSVDAAFSLLFSPRNREACVALTELRLAEGQFIPSLDCSVQIPKAVQNNTQTTGLTSPVYGMHKIQAKD